MRHPVTSRNHNRNHYRQVREFFRHTGVHPKKRFGQNFLIDSNILSKILATASLSNSDYVLEVGAGLGFLTSGLADNVKQVTAIEFDRLLYLELNRIFSESPNVTLVNKDILETKLSTLLHAPPEEQTKVISNLPYYLTTPILRKLVEHHHRISICVLMIQKELAQRIIASPGNKTYGALTIGISYYAQSELVHSVAPDCFYPRPQVESAIIKLKMQGSTRVAVDDEALFFSIVRAAFRARRKTLRNALLTNGVTMAVEGVDDIFTDLAIDSRRRGETLDITEFAALANGLSELGIRSKSLGTGYRVDSGG